MLGYDNYKMIIIDLWRDIKHKLEVMEAVKNGLKFTWRKRIFWQKGNLGLGMVVHGFKNLLISIPE